MGNRRLLTPDAIEHLIAEGMTIVIFKGSALKLDCWLDRHPGGRLAVLHMVGRDATNEIEIYHSPETILQIDRYCVGRIEKPWSNFIPPIRGGIFRNADQISAEVLQTVGVTGAISSPCLNLTTSKFSPNHQPAAQLVRGRPADESFKSTDSDIASIPGTFRVADSFKAQKSQDSAEKYISRIVQEEINTNIKDYPSLDANTQEEINEKYRALHRRVIREGFYDCPYSEYGKECIRYILLFTLFIITLQSEYYLTSAAFLGLFWHQIMFTAHDAGHRGITHHFVVDTLLGMFIADFCCGLSMGWWKSSHNIHHLITNHPEHDPDIQNVPLFATCPSFFRSLRSTYYDFIFIWDAFANFAVKYQTYTYYPVMGIARFNLYLLSIHHLFSNKSASRGMTAWIRPTELAFIGGYWFLFGYCLLWCSIPTWPLRIAFVLISHIVTFPLHVQITLSHWGMSPANLGESESFPQRQLRTTMDVSCSAWMDFVHGGLQFQVVHHLFPRVPRHNLRRLQGLVREFCCEAGIPYHVLGFADGNRKVLGRLKEISRHVAMLAECQRYMAETGESGMR